MAEHCSSFCVSSASGRPDDGHVSDALGVQPSFNWPAFGELAFIHTLGCILARRGRQGKSHTYIQRRQAARPSCWRKHIHKAERCTRRNESFGVTLGRWVNDEGSFEQDISHSMVSTGGFTEATTCCMHTARVDEGDTARPTQAAVCKAPGTQSHPDCFNVFLLILDCETVLA
jgi:hypothetical protein